MVRHGAARALGARIPTLSLDGDLPKREWFAGVRSERLSSRDGEIHTVVPGRPIGLHPETVAELGAEGVHLHFYGDFTHGQWKAWIERTRGLAPRHLHLHANVDQNRWVSEFSQYDAGWLHGFTSHNRGDIRRADWDDLNYPARIATLAAAGLPMIQKNNAGACVAIQSLGRERDLSVFYSSIPDLASQLRETDRDRPDSRFSLAAAGPVHLRRARRRVDRVLPNRHRYGVEPGRLAPSRPLAPYTPTGTLINPIETPGMPDHETVPA